MRSADRSAPARPVRATVGALALAGALTGCFTGERPTLSSVPQSTGDPAADAVLERLGDAATATFTARYQIASAAGEKAEAAVAQDGSTRRSITIGDTRYLVNGTSTATCSVGDGSCVDAIQPARVSDLGVTPDFYAASPAARLRRDAALRVGPTTSSTETIAGQPATCVIIPIAQSAARYCALDAGPLARMRTTDATVDLTEYAAGVDPAQFSPPAG
jgi:hypothetical protein